MSTEITIGADELILWLRKNRKQEETTTIQLGRKIVELMEKLGVDIEKDIIRDKESFWANTDKDKNIGEYGLPKTSAQYKIGIDKISKLYEAINNW